MPSDRLTLAFDTSAAHCAAALLLGDRVLARHFEAMQKGQAENLFPILEQVLSEAEKSWADLELIGVGVGPGNFTGIRISVASARGLALSLGIPAVGVSNFEALAYGHPRPTLCLIDARRGQIYAQNLTNALNSAPGNAHADHGENPTANAPEMISVDSLELTASDARLRVATPDHSAMWPFAVEPPTTPLAQAIALIAQQKAKQGTQPRPAPLYIRKADAAPPKDPAPTILV